MIIRSLLCSLRRSGKELGFNYFYNSYFRYQAHSNDPYEDRHLQTNQNWQNLPCSRQCGGLVRYSPQHEFASYWP